MFINIGKAKTKIGDQFAKKLFRLMIAVDLVHFQKSEAK